MFRIGDKVIITVGMISVPPEWIGKIGTVKELPDVSNLYTVVIPGLSVTYLFEDELKHYRNGVELMIDVL
jgi:hypothetical protein